jgi:hypothetical protein
VVGLRSSARRGARRTKNGGGCSSDTANSRPRANQVVKSSDCVLGSSRFVLVLVPSLVGGDRWSGQWDLRPVYLDISNLPVDLDTPLPPGDDSDHIGHGHKLIMCWCEHSHSNANYARLSSTARCRDLLSMVVSLAKPSLSWLLRPAPQSLPLMGDSSVPRCSLYGNSLRSGRRPKGHYREERHDPKRLSVPLRL